MAAWFANPWLLLSAAAVAVPVLVHLIEREDRGGRKFPSLMFVQRARFKSRRRRVLRDKPLLLLRCLALIVLALAFAAPQWSRAPEPVVTPAAATDSVILLDRSASMSAADRWRAAVDRVRRYLEQRAGDDRIALVAVDSGASLVVPLTRDDALLSGALSGLNPGPRGTRLGAGFDLANQILRESPAQHRRLVLVSDLQQSALADVDRLLLDTDIALLPEVVRTPVARNAAIIGAELSGGGEPERELRVRLLATGEQRMPDVSVQARLDGRLVSETRVALAPGAESEWRVPVTLAADRAMQLSLELGADDIPADNRRELVLAPLRPVRLGLLAPVVGDAGDGAGFFVRRAAELARAPAIEVAVVTPPPDAARLGRDIDLLVADDQVLADPAWRAAVDGFVRRGGGLLLGMAASSPAAALQRRPDWPDGLGAARAYPGAGVGLMASALSGTGPDAGVYAGLAAARIKLARGFTATDGDRVLARLDDGEPWLVQRRPGRGRLLLMTSGLGRDWSDLVLQPGFAAWLQEVAIWLAGRQPARMAYSPGEVMDLVGQASGLPGGGDWAAYLAAGGQLVVQAPSGRQRRLAPGETLLRGVDPGLYEVHRLDGASPSLRLAVNPDPAESLLASAELSSLQRAVVRRAPPARPAPVAGRPGTADTPPGWWLLVPVLVLFLAEAAWARRQRASGGMSPEVST